MTYLVGRRLGRYQLQEEIGRGGMARVYKAHDTQLQRAVALKVLAPQLAVDPEFAQRFEREAITAANLHHPNIVTIYDVGDEDGLRYFAMEFVDGRTLHAIIRERGALGLGPAVTIIAAVGAALDYAHRSGSIHRDIKPHNIMIHRDGRVLLTDFGIAQAPDRGEGGERLTRTGVFMGTPEYISPEQASAQRLDGRSDLYSLGITAYEIITGQVPFSGATPQLIVAHVQEPPPLPSSIDPRLPAALDTVMRRILAKRPEQRYDTADGFANALARVARQNDIRPAERSQIAALALPQPAPSAPATATGRENTQRAEQRAAPPVRPAMPPRRAPLDVTLTAPSRPAGANPARSAPRPAPAAPANFFGPRTQIIVAVIVLSILFYLMSRSFNQRALPFVTPTARAVSTIKPTIPPTATPTLTPTATPEPATATPEPATATPEPPAPVPPTPVPVIVPPPVLPSATPVPPTDQVPTDQVPTEPAPTDQVPTEPAPTAPAAEPTAPAATNEPAATDPAPAPTAPAAATSAASAATSAPAPTAPAPTTPAPTAALVATSGPTSDPAAPPTAPPQPTAG